MALARSPRAARICDIQHARDRALVFDEEGADDVVITLREVHVGEARVRRLKARIQLQRMLEGRH